MTDTEEEAVPPPQGWTLGEAVRALASEERAAAIDASDRFRSTPATKREPRRDHPYAYEEVENPDYVAAAESFFSARRVVMERLRLEMERRGLVALGRRDSGQSEPSLIDPTLWPAWDKVDLAASSVEGVFGGAPMSYHGIRIFGPAPAAAALTPATPVAGKVEGEAADRRQGGRPPKYQWESILDALAARVGVKGHPENQSALIRMIVDAALETGHETAPDEKTIRDKLKRDWTRLKAAVRLDD